MKSKPADDGTVEAPWPVGEFGGVDGRRVSGTGVRWGATEVLSRTPWPYSAPWLWWYIAAEIPLSCRRRTNPREVLVVRVASLHKQKEKCQKSMEKSFALMSEEQEVC